MIDHSRNSRRSESIQGREWIETVNHFLFPSCWTWNDPWFRKQSRSESIPRRADHDTSLVDVVSWITLPKNLPGIKMTALKNRFTVTNKFWMCHFHLWNIKTNLQKNTPNPQQHNCFCATPGTLERPNLWTSQSVSWCVAATHPWMCNRSAPRTT